MAETTAERIRKTLIDHPDWTPLQVARACSTTRHRVYQVKYDLRNRLAKEMKKLPKQMVTLHPVQAEVKRPEPVTEAEDEAFSNINSTLQQRGNRYGKFVHHAEITMALKQVIAEHMATHHIPAMAPDQQEALDMICHKIGRIVNGDPNYDDSWIDIAGYAKLVADRLNGVEV